MAARDGGAQRCCSSTRWISSIKVRPVVARNPPPPGTPYSWQWLDRPRRASRACPIDPTGVPFEIDPATGAVTVSRESQLFPMPRTLESK